MDHGPSFNAFKPQTIDYLPSADIDLFIYLKRPTSVSMYATLFLFFSPLVITGIISRAFA